jgi:hypothetical protein
MRTRIALAVLLSIATCALAALKNTQQPPSSTGILIAYVFGFDMQGDGISTTFTLTPSRVPPIYVDSGANYPNLPLVGVAGEGNCSNDTFAATVSSGKMLVTFPTPPPSNVVQNCSVVLLFQPE